MQVKMLGILIDRQPKRRALVATLYGSYAALITCFTFASSSGVGLVFAIGLLPAGAVLLSAFLALSKFALPYSTEGSGRQTALVDERQIQVRDRAFYRSYQVIASLFGLWVVYEAIARTNERQWFWVPQTFDEYQAIVWGYLILAMTLPSAFIAWFEPDAIEGDEFTGGELPLAR